MKIKIKAEFSTDGDYSICNYDSYKNEPISKSINGSGNEVKIYSRSSHIFIEDYTFIKIIECDNVDSCKMYARMFLSQLLCNISVLSSHYYLIKDFYELFDNGITAINEGKNYYETISGNYDGTELVIYIEE